jgi:hypothetical protein
MNKSGLIASATTVLIVAGLLGEHNATPTR